MVKTYLQVVSGKALYIRMSSRLFHSGPDYSNIRVMMIY